MIIEIERIGNKLYGNFDLENICYQTANSSFKGNKETQPPDEIKSIAANSSDFKTKYYLLIHNGEKYIHSLSKLESNIIKMLHTFESDGRIVKSFEHYKSYIKIKEMIIKPNQPSQLSKIATLMTQEVWDYRDKARELVVKSFFK